MAEHKDLTVSHGVHAPYAFEYANTAARTGASGLVSGDVGKFALQTDDGTIWRLTATAPTWEQVLQASDISASITLDEGNAPGTPATEKGVLYTKADGKPYWKDDQGLETDLTATGATSGGSSGDVQFADGAGGFTGASMLTLGQEAVKPSAPASGKLLVYGKTDDKLYFQDDQGLETEVGGGGGAEGSDTQVQFNDGGDFAGDGTFLFNKTTDTLTAKNAQITDLTVLGDVTGDVTGNLTGNSTGNLTGNVTGNLAGTPTAPQVILSEGSSPSTPDGATAVYTNTKKVITTLDEDSISRTLYGTRPVNGICMDGSAVNFLKIPDGQVVPAGSDGSLMWLSMWSVLPQRDVLNDRGGSDNISLMCLGAGVGGSGDADQLDFFLKDVDDDAHKTYVYYGDNLVFSPNVGGNTITTKEGSLPAQFIAGHFSKDQYLWSVLFAPGGAHICSATSKIEAALDLSAVGAQIGTGQSDQRVSGVVTGVCSVDTTSGFPLTRQDELMRALQIWFAEGEFRSLAAGELSGGVASGVTSPALNLHRQWRPSGIVASASTGVVTGWQALDSTGERYTVGDPATYPADMTVEGSWTAGPFISQQLWRP